VTLTTLSREHLGESTKCLLGFLALERSAFETEIQYIANYATDGPDKYGDRQEECRYRRQRSELREHFHCNNSQRFRSSSPGSRRSTSAGVAIMQVVLIGQ
jgi:hypothetical protein